jgi:GTPase SAR1 family protein
MRNRGASVFAKQSPFKAQVAQPVCSIILDAIVEPVCNKKLTAEETSKLFEDFGPVTKNSSLFKDVFSGDLETSGSELAETCSTTCSNRNSSWSTCKDDTEDIFEEENTKQQKLFRCMTIGSRESGKHALVNAICPESEGQADSSSFKQEFDLVTKRVETENDVKRYHFWLKEPRAGQKCYKSVISAYYKSCSTYFLVYNINDRTSFECLEREIQMIIDAKAGREVLLMLIGTKQSAGKCEVSFEEAISFKEKYNIQLFQEVNVHSDSVENLREVIECLLR